MRIEEWTIENVDAEGNTHDAAGQIDGNVDTEPGISMTDNDNGGCNLEKCHCSDGHWLTISFGRNPTTTVVRGVTVYFDNYGEMALFLATKNLRA